MSIFPQGIDTYTPMVNPSLASDYAHITLYNQAVQQQDIGQMNSILATYPEILPMMWTVDKYNNTWDTIIGMQDFLLNEFEPYLNAREDKIHASNVFFNTLDGNGNVQTSDSLAEKVNEITHKTDQLYMPIVAIQKSTLGRYQTTNTIDINKYDDGYIFNLLIYENNGIELDDSDNVMKIVCTPKTYNIKYMYDVVDVENLSVTNFKKMIKNLHRGQCIRCFKDENDIIILDTFGLNKDNPEWVSLGSSGNDSQSGLNLSYKKSGDIVCLQGGFSTYQYTSSTNKLGAIIIGTLPYGFRPAYTLTYKTPDVSINIYPSGEMEMFNFNETLQMHNGSYTSFHGVWDISGTMFMI